MNPKRIICLLICTLLLFSAITPSAFAADGESEGGGFFSWLGNLIKNIFVPTAVEAIEAELAEQEDASFGMDVSYNCLMNELSCKYTPISTHTLNIGDSIPLPNGGAVRLDEVSKTYVPGGTNRAKLTIIDSSGRLDVNPLMQGESLNIDDDLNIQVSLAFLGIGSFPSSSDIVIRTAKDCVCPEGSEPETPAETDVAPGIIDTLPKKLPSADVWALYSDESSECRDPQEVIITSSEKPNSNKKLYFRSMLDRARNTNTQVLLDSGNSDYRVTLNWAQNLKIARASFPIITHNQDAVSSFDVTFHEESLVIGDETFLLGETHVITSFSVPLSDCGDQTQETAVVDVYAKLENISTVSDVVEIVEDGPVVDVTVSGPNVILDGVTVGIQSGNMVHSNLMKTKALPGGAAGTTASEPSANSPTGGGFPYNFGDGDKIYYVKSVSKNEDSTGGTLGLSNARTGAPLSKTWTATGDEYYGTKGQVDTTDINIIKWGDDYPSYPDGISIGTSTASAVYQLSTLGLSFTVDTDWATYTHLKFSNGGILELKVQENVPKVTISGSWGGGVSATNTDSGGVQLTTGSPTSPWAIGTTDGSTATLNLFSKLVNIEQDVLYDVQYAVNEAPLSNMFQDSTPLIIIGEIELIGDIEEVCGELEYPNGTTSGVTYYDPTVMVEITIPGASEPSFISCPLRNSVTYPKITFVKDDE